MKQLITLLFLIPVILPAQTDDQKDVTRKVEDNGPDGMIIDYRLDDFHEHEIKKDGKTFTKVTVNGFSHMHENGLPALPSGRDMILIPENGTATVEIKKIKTDTIQNILVFPSQPLKPDGYAVKERQNRASENPRENREFTYNSTFYKQDQFYPEKIVKINQEQKIRDLSVGIVHVTPFKYNPVNRELVIIRELKYEIVFQGADNFFDNISQYSLQYLQKLPDKFLNSRSLSEEIQKSSDRTSISQDADYLIVNHSKFHMAADTLARWKRRLGHNVRIIERSQWTASQVKDSIHHVYNNAAVYPDYFVILGDQEYVPAELVDSSKGRYSDHYFACMNGPNDFTPDMARGRITAKTKNKALEVVNKIKDYKKNPPQSASFYDNALVAAYFEDDDTSGYANRRFVHTSEEVKSYLEGQNYSVERVYTTDPWVTPTHYNDGYYSNGQPIPPDLLRSNGFAWDGGASDIVNAFDKGKFIALHRDHGGSNGWAEPPFHSPDVANLNNNEELPVVLSLNCSSGKFVDNKAFAENFLQKSTGGAVGVIAASETSYSGPNDALATGLIDAIWANPGLTPNFGSGGITNPSPTPHQNIHQMGDVLNHGFLRMIETWGTSKITHELFHYHGDPAMSIWTDQPTPISISSQDTLSCGATSLKIDSSNVPDATATLLLNGKVLDEIQLSNGTGNLSFSAIANLKPYAILTVSAQGFKPYTTKIPFKNCSNPPQADYVVSDSTLNCFSNKATFYNNSLYQPDSLYWEFQPSTITYNSGSATSDKIQLQFNDTGYYDVKLSVKNAFGADSVVDNQRIYVASALQAPHKQTVEQLSAFGLTDTNWQSSGNSSYGWNIHKDSTPSFGTGPIFDHTTGTEQGYYFYTEASTGSKGDTALLVSPALDISGLTMPALKFYYHMYGGAINELHIDVNNGTGWQKFKSLYGHKQTGYDDAWQKELVDLSAFSGNCIKIRFRAIRGDSWDGDIAIDDIELFDYDTIPEISLKSSAENTCCSFTVEYEDLSCCGVTNREWTFPGGNPQQSSSKNPVITYDSAGTYDVKLKTENLHGADSIVKNGKISVRNNKALPVFEDFESFAAGNGTFYNDWAVEKTHDFEWEVGSGSTPSSGTGPVMDHTTGTNKGKYVYTEVSYLSEGEKSYLITPCFDLPDTENAFLTFWAHMYGAGIDTLHVDVNDGQKWHKDVFSVGGEQQTGHSDNWKKFNVDLSGFTGNYVMLRFRARRTGGWKDDKAIDDVNVFSGGLELSPDSVDFGDVNVGAAQQKEISVKNTSPDTLVLNQTSAPQKFNYSSVSGSKVNPSDSITIPVNFKPDSNGNFNGYFRAYSELNVDSAYLYGTSDPVDVESYSVEFNYEIFPNPVRKELNITLPNFDKPVDYRFVILNTNGQIVDQWESKNNNGKIARRRVDDLSRGVYQIRITSRKNTFTGKFVKF